MKRAIPFLLIISFLSACHTGAETRRSREIIDITTPDLGRIENGTYTGSFQLGLVAATVEITINDHRITDFVITNHRCGKGRPGEAVAGRVLEQQTLAVDTVSGATASSSVILKAAERALNGTGE